MKKGVREGRGDTQRKRDSQTDNMNMEFKYALF